VCASVRRAIGFKKKKRGDKVSLMSWCDDEGKDGAEEQERVGNAGTLARKQIKR
jgi:hypothetical protein